MIDYFIDKYENSRECHAQFLEIFELNVEMTSYIKSHRDFVDKYGYGYGEKAFHWIWKLLIDQMPESFKFLEIGIFQGQIISLVQLICDHEGKIPEIYGITPLSKDGDKYSEHPDIDYLERIESLYTEFELTLDNTNIIHGFSNEPEIINKTRDFGKFDILYIDGCHDFNVVVSDIENYVPMLSSNGFLVIDDASCFLQMPVNKFSGLEDPSLAVQSIIEEGFFKDELDHLFVIGHNRIWRKK